MHKILQYLAFAGSVFIALLAIGLVSRNFLPASIRAYLQF